MEYGRLVSRSFEIAWRYKSLWVFWMVGAAAVAHFNIPKGDLGSGGLFSTSAYDLTAPSFGDSWLLTMFIMFFSWTVFAVTFHIATGASIDAVNRIERGGIYKFTEALSAGMRFFWRLVGISIAVTGGMTLLLAVLTVAVVIAFLIHIAAGALLTLVAVPIALFAVLAATTVHTLGMRATVVRDMSIGDALSEAYLLFRQNKVRSLVVLLISGGLGLAATIITWVVMAMAAVPFGGASMVTDGSMVPGLIAAALVSVPFFVVFSSFSSLVQGALYTLFYFELVEPKYSVEPQTLPPAPEPV